MAKLAVSPPANPNITVTLDVMHHIIQGRQNNILVMLDNGDKMLRLSLLENDKAEKYFTYYFTGWIYLFDAPVYTVFDRGMKRAAQYMADQLMDSNHNFSQLQQRNPGVWATTLARIGSFTYIPKSSYRTRPTSNPQDL